MNKLLSCFQVILEVMDTSEPWGRRYTEAEGGPRDRVGDGLVVEVGAARDPARWSQWADLVLLVYSVTSKAESRKQSFLDLIRINVPRPV